MQFSIGAVLLEGVVKIFKKQVNLSITCPPVTINLANDLVQNHVECRGRGQNKMGEHLLGYYPPAPPSPVGAFMHVVRPTLKQVLLEACVCRCPVNWWAGSIS